MLNNQAPLDTRKLITGKDGQLFITKSDGTHIFLAEVDEFSVTLDVNTEDYQPVGSSLEAAVPTGYQVSIELTEAVVRDDTMVVEFLRDLKDGYFPTWTFQGSLRRRDGNFERMTFPDCVPSGSIDLMKIAPGEIVKRSWNFRMNSVPEMLEHFPA